MINIIGLGPGEFDYITKPFMNFIFQKLVPIYRKIQFRKNSKNND